MASTATRRVLIASCNKCGSAVGGGTSREVLEKWTYVRAGLCANCVSRRFFRWWLERHRHAHRPTPSALLGAAVHSYK